MVALLAAVMVAGLLATPSPAAAGGSLADALEASCACNPVVAEAEARLRAAREELEAERLGGLLELRGSYFYYPNASIVGNDLTETQQRADLYLRYPLLSRLRGVPDRLELLELEVREHQARLDATLGDTRAELTSHYLDLTRERQRETDLEVAVARSKERVEHLEALWQDKLVLLEEVLEEEARLASLRLDLGDSQSRAAAAAESVAALVCSETWEPETLPTGVISIPRELPLTNSTGPDPWLVRAEREQRLASRPQRNLRLDLEGGYTLEEDEDTGLEDGPRVGFRFVLPFSPGRGEERARAAHLAQREVWLARSRADRGETRREARLLLREAGRLSLEGELLDARARLLDERQRVRDLRGESFQTARDRSQLNRRRWQIYFRAWEIANVLGHDTPIDPQSGETPYRFSPPAPTSRPEPSIRKLPARGTYLWGGLDALGSTDEFLEFARAKGIVALYLSPGGKTLEPGDPALGRFLATAGEAGLAVQLLLGENTWARTDRRQGLERRLREYEAFQAAAPIPFAGLHLDVEPHALPEWPEQQEPLLAGLVAVAETARASLERLPRAGILSLSIPHWMGGRLSLDQRISLTQAADRLVLMSYGNFRDGTLQENFALWNADGPVSLELALRADDYPTEAALENAVHRYHALLPGSPRPVIHDLPGWRRLARSVGVQ